MRYNGNNTEENQPNVDFLQYGCIGEHLGHSFSPAIHAMLGVPQYRLRELAPDAVGAFLQARRFCGINVTLPYKQTVMPYLDRIDPAAEAIGAVNTVLCRDGELVGYNTDFYGMQAMLDRAQIALQGKTVAILGTGGTSKTARAVCMAGGASRIFRVSRKPCEADEIGYDRLAAYRDLIEVLINTTPVGMYPKEEGMPTDPAAFSHLCGVADAVYHPLRTDFVCRAQELGIPAVGGLYMLVAQAAQAEALFTGEPGMTEKIPEVYRRLRAEKQNIVLIGMPGCGKSTVGKLLGKMLGKPFYDSDRVLERRRGMPAGRYLALYGEAAFRRAETEVLRTLSAESGCIIATGGGAVTREENMRCLRRNGCLVYLARPLAELTPTADRPLTADRDALSQKFKEREPLYRGAADLTVSVCGLPKQTAACVQAAVDGYEE